MFDTLNKEIFSYYSTVTIASKCLHIGKDINKYINNKKLYDRFLIKEAYIILNKFPLDKELDKVIFDKTSLFNPIAIYKNGELLSVYSNKTICSEVNAIDRHFFIKINRVNKKLNKNDYTFSLIPKYNYLITPLELRNIKVYN